MVAKLKLSIIIMSTFAYYQGIWIIYLSHYASVQVVCDKMENRQCIISRLKVEQSNIAYFYLSHYTSVLVAYDEMKNRQCIISRPKVEQLNMESTLILAIDISGSR